MITFGDKCTLNVYQAIRASNCGEARRINKHTHRDEFARMTQTGVRIIKGHSDWTVVRRLGPGQDSAREWSAVIEVKETV
jgi:hypothetical protein